MRLYPVPNALLLEVPAQAWIHVTRAIERVGISDADEICTRVANGTALLWLAVEGQDCVGAGVTELDGNVCIIVAWGADNHAACAPLLSVIHEYARAAGCNAVRIYGREGWRRRLPEYRVKAVIMERPL